MSPLKRLIGCMAVVGRLAEWERFFDLSKPALRLSFVLQLLILPAFYFVALAANKARALALGEAPVAPQIAVIVIIGLVYLLSFSAVAYILTMVFDRQDRLRPWVIVRHWCVFFLAWIAAAGFGLFSLGLLPLAAAYGIVFAAFMGSLIVDIRLAQRVVGFDWGAAILTACLISITGMSLLLTGVSQLSQL